MELLKRVRTRPGIPTDQLRLCSGTFIVSSASKRNRGEGSQTRCNRLTVSLDVPSWSILHLL